MGDEKKIYFNVDNFFYNEIGIYIKLILKNKIISFHIKDKLRIITIVDKFYK